MCKSSFQKIVTVGKTLYDQTMSESCSQVSNWVDAVKFHETARQKAVALFQAPEVYQVSSKVNFVEELNDCLQRAFESEWWPFISMRSITATEEFILKNTQHIDDVEETLKSFSDVDSIEDLTLGPERYRLLYRSLLQNVIEARLYPQLKDAVLNNSVLQEELDKANITIKEMKIILQQEKSDHAKSILSSCETTSDISLGKEVVESGRLINSINNRLEPVSLTNNPHNEKTIGFESLQMSLEEEQKAHEQTREQLTLKELDLNRIGQELISSRHTIKLNEDDNTMLRDELDEIISAVTDQQSEFDRKIANSQGDIVRLEIKLLLYDIISSVEYRTVVAEKMRIEEERAVLKSNLSNFHQIASSLPQWLQEYFKNTFT